MEVAAVAVEANACTLNILATLPFRRFRSVAGCEMSGSSRPKPGVFFDLMDGEGERMPRGTRRPTVGTQ
jgi:hypothetical protein